MWRVVSFTSLLMVLFILSHINVVVHESMYDKIVHVGSGNKERVAYVEKPGLQSDSKLPFAISPGQNSSERSPSLSAKSPFIQSGISHHHHHGRKIHQCNVTIEHLTRNDSEIMPLSEMTMYNPSNFRTMPVPSYFRNFNSPCWLAESSGGGRRIACLPAVLLAGMKIMCTTINI